MRHSDDRLWQGCAIYCKRSDTGGWYTPRLEVWDSNISYKTCLVDIYCSSWMICQYLRISLTELSATLKAQQITTVRGTCVWRRAAGWHQLLSLWWRQVNTDISRVAKYLDPDLDLPMNAAPEEVEQKIPDTLSKYFTLDTDFNPVGVSNPALPVCLSAQL